MNLGQYANLVRVLAQRDLKANVNRTVLGYFWMLALPLTYVLVFSLYRMIFGINIGEGVPYVPYTFAGIMLWMLFSGIVAASYQSIASNASIIKKMDTPRLVFFATAFVVPLINFGVSLVFFLAICLLFGWPVGFAILWLPLSVAMILVLAAGVGMLTVAIGIYRHDIVVALPIVLQVWMLLTPIFYPVEAVPEQVRWLLYLNPLAGIIAAFRDPFFLQQVADPRVLAGTAVAALVIAGAGYLLFQRTGRYLADVL